MTRRILAALAAAVVLTAMVWFPYDRFSRESEELRQVELRVSELEKRISTREELLAEARLLERTSPIEALLLHGDTAALAGAELQGLVTVMVESAGGVISQTQVVQPRDAEPFVQIAVRIDFVVSMSGLRDILHSVETSEPVMLADRITLTTERSSGAEVGEHVQVSLEVDAFSQKAAPQ
ncbi:MAG: type II secretion system protein GspM [Geminicoccaceae bacterium]